MPNPKLTDKISLEEVERLCSLCPTNEELAAALKINPRTIYRHMKTPAFAEAVERGKANGRMTLRGLQMKAANNGNPAMLIWLGKQLLGQKDRHELSGPDNGPIPVVISQADSEL